MERGTRARLIGVAGGLALAVLVAALLAGCGSGQASGDGPGQTIRLSPPPKGSATVEAKVGDTVVISLAANVTTGYQWTLTPGDTFTIAKSVYVPDPNPDQLAGKGGTQIVTLKVTSAGASDLTGVYARSWETPKGGHVTPDVTVTVESQ